VLKTCGAFWLSHFLSGAILLGSLAVKLPQIFNIVMSGDVEGISPEAFYSEVPLSIHTVMYNYRNGYPFMTYGETAIVMVQNLALVFILWKYMSPSPSSTTIFSVLSLFIGITVGCFYLPAHYLYLLPTLNLPLMIYSRLAQIIANANKRTTGQLSSITTLLTFAGSLARVFTTIQQVGYDLSLIGGFVTGACLSGILLAQVSKVALF
jgi:hypothetical protein